MADNKDNKDETTPEEEENLEEESSEESLEEGSDVAESESEVEESDEDSDEDSEPEAEESDEDSEDDVDEDSDEDSEDDVAEDSEDDVAEESDEDSEDDVDEDSDEDSEDDVDEDSDEDDDSDDSDDSDEDDDSDDSDDSDDDDVEVFETDDDSDDANDDLEASESEDDSDDDDDEEPKETVDEGREIVTAGDDADKVVPPAATGGGDPEGIKGIAAFFDLPDELMVAASHIRESEYEDFEAYSPFPIHGMDDAMGLGRSWIPWVTFGAGSAGFITANALQFGTMTFDWPMIVGGMPYAPWPSFVPIMFELTVLLAGCTTALVMLIAAGCFRKPFIIDREITKDRFVLWISADDDAFDADAVSEFMKSLDPVEIRTVTKGA